MTEKSKTAAAEKPATRFEVQTSYPLTVSFLRLNDGSDDGGLCPELHDGDVIEIIRPEGDWEVPPWLKPTRAKVTVEPVDQPDPVPNHDGAIFLDADDAGVDPTHTDPTDPPKIDMNKETDPDAR